MQAHTIAPGVYAVEVRGHQRHYLVRGEQIRFMRSGGQVSRELAGRVTPHGVQPIAQGSARTAVIAIGAGRARLVAAYCRECGRELTDPTSVRLQIGPECRKTRQEEETVAAGPAVAAGARPQEEHTSDVPVRCAMARCTRWTTGRTVIAGQLWACCPSCTTAAAAVVEAAGLREREVAL